MVSEQQGGGGYAFAQQPRAVAETRKYRDPAMAMTGDHDDRLSVNIMWDRRVVRGNTYAAQVLPATAVPDPVALQKDAEERKLRELKPEVVQELFGTEFLAACYLILASLFQLHKLMQLRTRQGIEAIANYRIDVDPQPQPAAN